MGGGGEHSAEQFEGKELSKRKLVGMMNQITNAEMDSEYEPLSQTVAFSLLIKNLPQLTAGSNMRH